MHAVVVPPGLEERRALGSEWSRWLDGLPRAFDELLDEWELRVDGTPAHGYCSLVLPVRDARRSPLALKVSFDGDDESALEHLALTHWRGDGTVRLVRANPRRRALLLERLEERDLSDEWDVAACELIGERYRRLHIPAGEQFTRLSDVVRRWQGQLDALPADAPLPRRVVDRAKAIARRFAVDEATDGRLVHGDLHYGNVLASAAGGREEWLVIDPKPLSGDPHFEPAPLLWNRWDELAGDVRGGLRRRFEAVVDAGLLDEHRARDWVVLRCVVNAGWRLADAKAAGRTPDAADLEWITRCLTIAKAVD